MPTDADNLPQGFELLSDGLHNIRAIRMAPCTPPLHGRCELQVLFRHGSPIGSRYHYQGVHIETAEALKKSEHPTTYLNQVVKPQYHFYRADVTTGAHFALQA